MPHINKVTVAGVLSGLVAFGNWILPVLPPAWAALVSALLGIYALYHGSKAVVAARAGGITI